MKEFLNKILLGDAAAIMASMPENSIDLTITSPPYDNLRDYKGYHFDFESIAANLYRVTKAGGVVVWVVGDATVKGSETCTSFKQALHFKELGFNLHDTMIWVKTSPYPANVRYQQDFEYMFIFSKGKPTTFNPLQERKSEKEIQKILKGQANPITKTYRNKDGSIVRPDEAAKKRLINASNRLMKNRSNVWRMNAGYMINSKDIISYEHPASFPEELAENHILSWSNEGDTILDCMCGSGTVLKMATLHNRKFVGIDCSTEYVDIAERRLAALEV